MFMKKRKYWSNYEINFLLENIESLTDSEIAKILKKTLKAVRRKREKLQLIKQNGRGVCLLREEQPNNDQDSVPPSKPIFPPKRKYKKRCSVRRRSTKWYVSRKTLRRLDEIRDNSCLTHKIVISEPDNLTCKLIIVDGIYSAYPTARRR